MIVTQEIIQDHRLRQATQHILQVEVQVLALQVLQVEVQALQVVVADVDNLKNKIALTTRLRMQTPIR